MKSVKPILLLSFLFFASVIADDFSEPVANLESSNEIEDYDDSDEFDFDDLDFGNEDEDIVYTNMISKKPPPSPTSGLSNSKVQPVSNFIPAGNTVSSQMCKKKRCKLNGYIPIWNSDVTALCRDNYSKLSWSSKASCQERYCMQVCV